MTKPGEEQPLLDVEDLPTEIDHLMSLNPLGLTPEAREAYLDGVIAYHRNMRAQKEAGIKPARRAKAASGEAPKIDLLALGLTKPMPKITRRL